MPNALVINGSPRLEKGNTALLLSAFIEGMESAGAEVELIYASKVKVKPCSCGRMACWEETPGECCIKDSMQALYPQFRAAEHLVLATPVYIPLPGDLQNIINRMCPIIDPLLVFREGRTRAQQRPDVAIKSYTALVTSGWWEVENCDTVVRIVKELAADASVPFAGALLRPHAYVMRDANGVTPQGQAVLDAAKKAGQELITAGVMRQNTLDAVSIPLIEEEDYRRQLNS